MDPRLPALDRWGSEVHKAGETDVSHKDYMISWRSAASGEPRVTRGSTFYTPDLTTSRRALALAVTTQVSRYCSSSFRPLAGHMWPGKRGCTTVHKTVVVTL